MQKAANAGKTYTCLVNVIYSRLITSFSRVPDHICLVATFIIVFHFLIIDLGQRSTLSEKAYVGIRVCVFWPSLFHGKTELPVCVLLPTSVLLFYLPVKAKTQSTEVESSLNAPISFKVTAHQLESEPAHSPTQGQGFSVCV